MKKYVSKTCVSISVVLATGVNRFIEFTPQTSGGSVFYTADAALQAALERHYKYGKLFKADETYESESRPVKEKSKPVKEKSKPKDAAETTTEAKATTESEKAEDEKSEPEVHKVVVSDPDTAKQYLAEHYNVSKSKIKSIKAIKAAAAEHGIEFEGI